MAATCHPGEMSRLVPFNSYGAHLRCAASILDANSSLGSRLQMGFVVILRSSLRRLGSHEIPCRSAARPETVLSFCRRLALSVRSRLLNPLGTSFCSAQSLGSRTVLTSSHVLVSISHLPDTGDWDGDCEREIGMGIGMTIARIQTFNLSISCPILHFQPQYG
jgi:hypothetical protein